MSGTTPPSRTSPPRTLAGLGLMRLPRAEATPAPDPDTPVTGLAVDSRTVVDGHVFVAIPGTRLDGAAFAQYAVRQGAVAVVATEAGAARLRADLPGAEVPVFLAADPRAEAARLAAGFFPGRPGTLAAVTGTNGKTSVAWFLARIWAHAGLASASLGTLGVRGAESGAGTGAGSGGFDADLGHTTPEPITLHRALDRLGAQGCTHAVLEASSHGLEQRRLDHVPLQAAALTNIQRDHLDYHPSQEAYVAAKMRLFADVLPAGAAAVVNAHDPAAERVGEIAGRRGLRLLTVGRMPEADLRLDGQRFEADGQSLTLHWQGAPHPLHLPLIGPFQGENVAVAAGLALACGLEAEKVFAALPHLDGVPGRMQPVATRANGARIVVDYAHTPDAVAAAVAALRPHCRGRLVIVLGAGGDRDRGKRVPMGEAAARADHVIVTDDNPRSEDPAAIRAAVRQGCPKATEIGDRAAAILAGTDALDSEGDMLLIAGKGHETGQEVAGEIRPFDDAEQARASVAALDGVAAAMGGKGRRG